MKSIKAYLISPKIKIKLGKLIKLLRLKRLRELKNVELIENNPYTKENFCEHNQICHYHTLTKLEHSYIRDNNLYHYFLKKLDLQYQVKEEEHLHNINILTDLAWDVLDLLDCYTNEKRKNLEKKIQEMNFQNDCLANINLMLLKQAIQVFIYEQYDRKMLEELKVILPIFDDIFQPIGYQVVANYYYYLKNYQKAEEFYLRANIIYQNFNINKGIILFPLIDIFVNNNNIYQAIKICQELEPYYVLHNNKVRLLSIYTHFVNYYLIVNSIELAKKYYDEAMQLINDVNDDDYLYREKIALINYNLAYYKLEVYDYENALKYFTLVLSYTQNNTTKLQIINRILICKEYLNYSYEDLQELINLGKKYYHSGDSLNKEIFYYFINLLNKQYDKLLHNEIINALKKDVKEKNILLYFYENLKI